MLKLYFYHELENKFEDQLNEIYETVKICGYNYDAGRALRLTDEKAFNYDCSDFVAREYQELLFSQLTEQEIEHYCVSEYQVVYCHNNEFEGN